MKFTLLVFYVLHTKHIFINFSKLCSYILLYPTNAYIRQLFTTAAEVPT